MPVSRMKVPLPICFSTRIFFNFLFPTRLGIVARDEPDVNQSVTDVLALSDESLRGTWGGLDRTWQRSSYAVHAMLTHTARIVTRRQTRNGYADKKHGAHENRRLQRKRSSLAAQLAAKQMRQARKNLLLAPKTNCADSTCEFPDVAINQDKAADSCASHNRANADAG